MQGNGKKSNVLNGKSDICTMNHTVVLTTDTTTARKNPNRIFGSIIRKDINCRASRV